MLPEAWNLTGRVALLAGNGRRGNPVLAAGLAEAGADVAVAGAPQEELAEAEQRVHAAGRRSLALPTDVTREEEVAAAVARVVGQWGRLDILVTNIQVEWGRPFVETTAAEWDALMQRNVRSLFLLCREAGQQMLRQGGGRIVNILSGLAERGLWNATAYCASQGAVLQLTRALALEWSRSNIRVNALGTGWLSVEEPSPEEQQQDRLTQYIPLRRKGRPEDLVAALVYLASDACDYTVGSTIYIDGGLMAHA
ncbi:MAG: SDR family NAD(P)-dependent oxidoreductase [Dehalococcoidia bacterium]